MRVPEFRDHDSEFAVCPWCRSRNGDLWELDWGSTDESTEIDCGECGRGFLVRRYVDITYSTARPKEPTP